MIEWERLECKGAGLMPIFRAKVPGGWLIRVQSCDSGVNFYPDPNHSWDGNSLD
ncbi:MAG: hypothetical protein J0665_04395 [Deltaproteobacteria bacterium]|jgi:hypothetical protein|nr:hypothetical protein [Deltaproteobacteria bacterium]